MESSTPTNTVNTGALAGVKVIEMGQLIAGPFCGQLLGDMGAEVVKIEAAWRGRPDARTGAAATTLWWEVIARNKKTVSANLRVPRRARTWPAA